MSACLSVCPPARMGQFGSHWTDFREILIFYFFADFVEKIQVWLKFDMNSGYLPRASIYIFFLSYLAHFFVESEMLQTKIVEKIKTRILCSIPFSRKSCHLWDNVHKYCRAGQYTVTVWRMRIAWWITRTTDTLRVYNTYCFSRATVVTRTRLSSPIYLRCLSCWISLSRMSS